MVRTHVIIGASLAGATAATTLRQLGNQDRVVLIGAEPELPYERPPLSKAYLRGEMPLDLAPLRPSAFYAEHGIETMLGTPVAAVVGIGVEPVVDLLDGSGVRVDNGVLVDEYCQTTIDGIFAAGDVANHYHPIFDRRIRVEHWHNAMKQGAVAARNIVGQRARYDEVHWFWSDQYHVNLQYAGYHRSAEQTIVRGALDSDSFLVCYVNDGRIDAALACNRAKELRRVMPLIKSRQAVPLERLRDETVDVRSLAAA